MIIRCTGFIILLLLSASAPLWLFVLCAIAYMFRFTAYEVIVLGVCIDVYYGGGGISIPYYTLGSTLLLLLIEYAKPYISLYNVRS